MESSEEITARGGHQQPQLWQKDEFEIGGNCEDIPLPQTESIPQQNWTVACGWIPIVGRDIVACLFSRDWEVSVYLFFVKSISRKFFVKMRQKNVQPFFIFEEFGIFHERFCDEYSDEYSTSV